MAIVGGLVAQAVRPAVTSLCSLCKSTLPSTCAWRRSRTFKPLHGNNGVEVGLGRGGSFKKTFQGMVWWFLAVTSRLLVSGCTRLDQRAPVYSWIHMVFRKSGWADHRWVRCSPPIAEVPTSCVCHSMCVSWWTKRDLVRFFWRFFPFSRTTNFIPPFLHTHLIHFVSFHQPLWWYDRRGRPVPLPFTDLQCRGSISSHPSTRPCVGHDLRMFWRYFLLEALY